MRVFDQDARQSAVLRLAFHAGAQRGVVGVDADAQVAHEVLDLVDGDGIADAGVDPAALLQRDTTVDTDQFAVHVEQRAARVTGVDRGVDLDAVGILQQRAGRVLVTVNAADQAEGDGRREVRG